MKIFKCPSTVKKMYKWGYMYTVEKCYTVGINIKRKIYSGINELCCKQPHGRISQIKFWVKKARYKKMYTVFFF